MSDQTFSVELAHLPIAKMQDVMLARFVGRDEATKLGFAPVVLTRVATAISEITRNVIQHAGAPGELRLGKITNLDQSGLRIVISDHGKGIAGAERYLEEGKTGTLGAGLTGTRRLVDRFHLQSSPGAGTVVTMDFWRKELAP